MKPKSYSYLVGVDGPGPSVLQPALSLYFFVINRKNASVTIIQSHETAALFAIYFSCVLCVSVNAHGAIKHPGPYRISYRNYTVSITLTALIKKISPLQRRSPGFSFFFSPLCVWFGASVSSRSLLSSSPSTPT